MSKKGEREGERGLFRRPVEGRQTPDKTPQFSRHTYLLSPKVWRCRRLHQLPPLSRECCIYNAQTSMPPDCSMPPWLVWIPQRNGAVCGITALKIKTFVPCTTVSHTRCLSDTESFHCEETRSLRSIVNIYDEAEYISDLQNVSDLRDLSTEEEENDLTDWFQLSKEEIIKKTKHLTRTVKQLEPSQNPPQIILQPATKRREEVLSVLTWTDQPTAAVGTIRQAKADDASPHTLPPEHLSDNQV